MDPRRFALLLPILAGIGCAPGGPRLPPVGPGPDGGAIVARLLAEQPCPPDLASDLQIALETPEHRSVRMAGRMRAVWPDRLRIQARVGAFWPVASIAIDGDSAFVSLPRLKGYWAGVPARGIGDHPAVLAASLLWFLCPSRLAAAIDGPTLDPGAKGWILRGILAGADPPVSVDIHLPGDRAEVREVLFRNPSGQILLRARRLGRKTVDGAGIAETIRLETEEPRTRLEVRFLRPGRDPDAPPEIFRISRPPSARWIAEEDLLGMIGAAGARR